MKCQILFSGKNKKNNIILSSAENAQRVVKVKLHSCLCDLMFISFTYSCQLHFHFFSMACSQ